MRLHNRLKYVVIEFADKARKFRIRRQFAKYVKSAVMSDNQVVGQVIVQVCNL